jgi:hypothetical protein
MPGAPVSVADETHVRGLFPGQPLAVASPPLLTPLGPTVAAHALPAALPGVAPQRPVNLDTVSVARHVGPVSRLAEDPHRCGIPKHFFDLSTRPCGRQRRGRQPASNF